MEYDRFLFVFYSLKDITQTHGRHTGHEMRIIPLLFLRPPTFGIYIGLVTLSSYFLSSCPNQWNMPFHTMFRIVKMLKGDLRGPVA